MPLTYTVSSRDRLVHVVATGAVVSGDIPQMQAALSTDAAITAGMRFLVVAADVQPDLTFTDLREAAQTLSLFKEKGIREMAIVTDTSHAFALATVFAVFTPASTIDVKVFRDQGDALAWLARCTADAAAAAAGDRL